MRSAWVFWSAEDILRVSEFAMISFSSCSAAEASLRSTMQGTPSANCWLPPSRISMSAARRR